jgi:hypothetical protein
MYCGGVGLFHSNRNIDGTRNASPNLGMKFHIWAGSIEVALNLNIGASTTRVTVHPPTRFCHAIFLLEE